jgi:hypothetical protein
LENLDSSISVKRPATAIPMQQDHFSFISDFAPSSPPAFGDSTILANDEGDNFILSSAADDSFTSKDDEKLDCSDVHSPSESSSQNEFDKSYLDLPCETLLPIERNPDFINIDARLELGENSDSHISYHSEDDDMYGPPSDFCNTEDGFDGAFLFPGMEAVVLPSNAHLIGPSTLQPADEALLALVIENNLPQDMYNKILDWANFAQYTNYKIRNAPVFRTALSRMHAKYVNVCGGPPLSEVVAVPGYQPMHVYRFDFCSKRSVFFSMKMR